MGGGAGVGKTMNNNRKLKGKYHGVFDLLFC